MTLKNLFVVWKSRFDWLEWLEGYIKVSMTTWILDFLWCDLVAHCATQVEENLQKKNIKVKPLLRCYSEFIFVYICIIVLFVFVLLFIYLPIYLFIHFFVYLFIYLFTVFSNQCFVDMENIIRTSIWFYIEFCSRKYYLLPFWWYITSLILDN